MHHLFGRALRRGASRFCSSPPGRNRTRTPGRPAPRAARSPCRRHTSSVETTKTLPARAGTNCRIRSSDAAFDDGGIPLRLHFDLENRHTIVCITGSRSANNGFRARSYNQAHDAIPFRRRHPVVPGRRPGLDHHPPRRNSLREAHARPGRQRSAAPSPISTATASPTSSPARTGTRARAGSSTSSARSTYTNNYIDDFSDLPLDVNGDGHIDIVSCAWFAKRLWWIENPGHGKGEWKEHEIETGFAHRVRLPGGSG